MIKAKAILILTIVTLGLMLWQARLPLWNQHLQVDIWVWWPYFFRFNRQRDFAANAFIFIYSGFTDSDWLAKLC